jgi:hypothetical protein
MCTSALSTRGYHSNNIYKGRLYVQNVYYGILRHKCLLRDTIFTLSTTFSTIYMQAYRDKLGRHRHYAITRLQVAIVLNSTKRCPISSQAALITRATAYIKIYRPNCDVWLSYIMEMTVHPTFTALKLAWYAYIHGLNMTLCLSVILQSSGYNYYTIGHNAVISQ